MARTRLARALAALTASIAALGCAAPGPTSPATPLAAFDPQACAEDALRKRPDPALVLDAVRVSATCSAGDPAACSVLGVLTELGLGVRRERARALSLYRRACESGNQRGCGNLGEALLADLERGEQPDGAIALLELACDAGNARPCAVLGRAYARSAAVPRRPEVAAGFFERACARGDGAACFELVDLLEGRLRPARATQLLERACGQEVGAACARLARPVQPATPVALGVRGP